SHPSIALGSQFGEFRNHLSILVKQFLRPITSHPVFEDLHVFRFRLQISHRHLMRAPSALYRLSVDRFRSRPTLRTAQDHHWPGWQAQIAAIPSLVSNRSNFVHYGVQSSGHELMHRFWLMSLDKIGLPAVTGEEMSKLLVIHPAKHSRICDLVPVEMQDGQHGTVTCRIEKLV